MSVTTAIYAIPAEPLNPERIPQTLELVRHLMEAHLLDSSWDFGLTIFPVHLDRMIEPLHSELGVWHHCKTINELEKLWQTITSPRRIAFLGCTLSDEATIDFTPFCDPDNPDEKVVLHSLGVHVGRNQFNDPTGESLSPIFSDHLLVSVGGDGSTSDEEGLIAQLTTSPLGQSLLQWLGAQSGVEWRFKRCFVYA